jgi:hypothetical protein
MQQCRTKTNNNQDESEYNDDFYHDGKRLLVVDFAILVYSALCANSWKKTHDY